MKQFVVVKLFLIAIAALLTSPMGTALAEDSPVSILGDGALSLNIAEKDLGARSADIDSIQAGEIYATAIKGHIQLKDASMVLNKKGELEVRSMTLRVKYDKFEGKRKGSVKINLVVGKIDSPYSADIANSNQFYFELKLKSPAQTPDARIAFPLVTNLEYERPLVEDNKSPWKLKHSAEIAEKLKAGWTAVLDPKNLDKYWDFTISGEWGTWNPGKLQEAIKGEKLKMTQGTLLQVLAPLSNPEFYASVLDAPSEAIPRHLMADAKSLFAAPETAARANIWRVSANSPSTDGDTIRQEWQSIYDAETAPFANAMLISAPAATTAMIHFLETRRTTGLPGGYQWGADQHSLVYAVPVEEQPILGNVFAKTEPVTKLTWAVPATKVVFRENGPEAKMNFVDLILPLQTSAEVKSESTTVRLGLASLGSVGVMPASNPAPVEVKSKFFATDVRNLFLVSVLSPMARNHLDEKDAKVTLITFVGKIPVEQETFSDAGPTAKYMQVITPVR